MQEAHDYCVQIRYSIEHSGYDTAWMDWADAYALFPSYGLRVVPLKTWMAAHIADDALPLVPGILRAGHKSLAAAVADTFRCDLEDLGFTICLSEKDTDIEALDPLWVREINEDFFEALACVQQKYQYIVVSNNQVWQDALTDKAANVFYKIGTSLTATAQSSLAAYLKKNLQAKVHILLDSSAGLTGAQKPILQEVRHLRFFDALQGSKDFKFDIAPLFPELHTFDSRGLEHVTRIHDRCFAEFPRLHEIETRGFIAVIEIGDDMGRGSPVNGRFSTFPFGRVRKIGHNFMNQTCLTAFQCQGFKNVVYVGAGFLMENVYLREVDSRGLENAYIERRDFLGQCEQMQDLDARGLSPGHQYMLYNSYLSVQLAKLSTDIKIAAVDCVF